MPYNHNYTMCLFIGFQSATRTGTVNPSQHFEEDEWNDMTEEDQQQWLEDYSQTWAENYIEVSVTE